MRIVEDSLQVEGEKGSNAILVEVSNASGDWQLALRLTDNEGNAPIGLQ